MKAQYTEDQNTEEFARKRPFHNFKDVPLPVIVEEKVDGVLEDDWRPPVSVNPTKEVKVEGYKPLPRRTGWTPPGPCMNTDKQENKKMRERIALWREE